MQNMCYNLFSSVGSMSYSNEPPYLLVYHYRHCFFFWGKKIAIAFNSLVFFSSMYLYKTKQHNSASGSSCICFVIQKMNNKNVLFSYGTKISCRWYTTIITCYYYNYLQTNYFHIFFINGVFSLFCEFIKWFTKLSDSWVRITFKTIIYRFKKNICLSRLLFGVLSLVELTIFEMVFIFSIV